MKKKTFFQRQKVHEKNWFFPGNSENLPISSIRRFFWKNCLLPKKLPVKKYLISCWLFQKQTLVESSILRFVHLFQPHNLLTNLFVSDANILELNKQLATLHHRLIFPALPRHRQFFFQRLVLNLNQHRKPKTNQKTLTKKEKETTFRDNGSSGTAPWIIFPSGKNFRKEDIHFSSQRFFFPAWNCPWRTEFKSAKLLSCKIHELGVTVVQKQEVVGSNPTINHFFYVFLDSR